MIEKLNQWQEMLEDEWWGGVAVYIAVFVSSYVTIWTIIEPLNIHDQITIFNSQIDRRLIHLSLAILLAAHVTLALDFNRRRKRRVQSLDASSKQELGGKIPPLTKELLMYYRILAKDERVSPKEFISVVLLAVNRGDIQSEFANELLRGTGVLIRQVRNKGYYTFSQEEVEE